MGSARTATVSKILAGTARKDRRRDDAAVKPKGKPIMPTLPPGEAVSIRERYWWNWYMGGLIASVHGAVDGALLLRLCRATARLEKLEAAADKVTTTTPGGRTLMNPAYGAMTNASREYRHLLSECGLSPVSRLRFAPGEGGGVKPGGTAWDDLD
jgi:hypothetical protein